MMRVSFKTWPLIVAAVLLASAGCRSHTQPPPKSGVGANAKVEAAARVNIQNLFTPSGWMGDGEYDRKYIVLAGDDRTQPHAQPTSIKIAYTFGPQRWGGLYWQNFPNNWGDKPGNNYSGKGLSKVTFWARGETGDEVVEFKVGGIDSPGKQYRDSVETTLGRVTLTTEWKQYTIDLSGQNLNSVIGGFCWVVSSDYNSASRIVFYLEDIAMQ